MKRKTMGILLIIFLLALSTGCMKKGISTGENTATDNTRNVKRKELSDAEKKLYIEESNIKSYIPEGANYSIDFVHLKGKEIPEIICTYDISGIDDLWKDELFIFEYDKGKKSWEEIFKVDDRGVVMTVLGTLDASDGREVATYGKASDGTAGVIGVDIIEYNPKNKEISIETISPSISYASHPDFYKEEQTIVFEGFSHNEIFKWNGKDFEHEISEIVVDIVPDIEIHFTIKDGKPVFTNEDLFKEPMIVKKGDIIAFIQDDFVGGIDRFSGGDGLEPHEKAKNYLVVTKEGESYASMRVNADWYEFEFIAPMEYSSEPVGKELTKEDFYIRLNDKRDLKIQSGIEEVKKLLHGGKITEIEVSPNDKDIILYKLEKDDVNVLYYDNPADRDFQSFIEMIYINSPKHSTFRGLKVGDSYEKMIELYGHENEFFDNGNSTIYLYETSGEEDFLALIIEIDNKTNQVVGYNVSFTL